MEATQIETTEQKKTWKERYQERIAAVRSFRRIVDEDSAKLIELRKPLSDKIDELEAEFKANNAEFLTAAVANAEAKNEAEKTLKAMMLDYFKLTKIKTAVKGFTVSDKTETTTVAEYAYADAMKFAEQNPAFLTFDKAKLDAYLVALPVGALPDWAKIVMTQVPKFTQSIPKTVPDEITFVDEFVEPVEEVDSELEVMEAAMDEVAAAGQLGAPRETINVDAWTEGEFEV